MNLNPHGIDIDTIQPGDTVTFKGTVVCETGISGSGVRIRCCESGNNQIVAMEDITSIERTPIPIELGQYWSGRRIDKVHHEATWRVYNIERLPYGGETSVHLYMTLNPGLVVSATADNLRADWVLVTVDDQRARVGVSDFTCVSCHLTKSINQLSPDHWATCVECAS